MNHRSRGDSGGNDKNSTTTTTAATTTTTTTSPSAASATVFATTNTTITDIPSPFEASFPQESVFSSLLFNIFINGLCEAIN
jgi:hypothetical protein